MVELFASDVNNLVSSLATARSFGAVTASTVALLLAVAASFAKTMVPLRALTVASNGLFLIAAALTSNPIAMFIYVILIPVNSVRLFQIVRLSRRVVEASAHSELTNLWLKPYMRSRRLPAGTMLFRKGDCADSLYLLVEGELEWLEIGTQQSIGQLFGEVSFFSPDQVRTISGRCVTACHVLSIAEPTFKQLYFQNPQFAFHVSGLITRRLSADVQRLQERIVKLETGKDLSVAINR